MSVIRAGCRMSLGRNGMRTDLVLRHNHDTATFPTLTKVLNTNPGPDPNTNHNSSFFSLGELGFYLLCVYGRFSFSPDKHTD